MGRKQFTVSRQVDCPRPQVDVHEVVDDPALDVALVLVHQDLLSGVEYLDEAEPRLQGLVQCLVLIGVVLDALLEVLDDRVGGEAHVVGAVDLQR